jgi:hypothetical protein
LLEIWNDRRATDDHAFDAEELINMNWIQVTHSMGLSERRKDMSAKGQEEGRRRREYGPETKGSHLNRSVAFNFTEGSVGPEGREGKRGGLEFHQAGESRRHEEGPLDVQRVHSHVHHRDQLLRIRLRQQQAGGVVTGSKEEDLSQWSKRSVMRTWSCW